MDGIKAWPDNERQENPDESHSIPRERALSESLAVTPRSPPPEIPYQKIQASLWVGRRRLRTMAVATPTAKPIMPMTAPATTAIT